jgi:Na+/proline symporter
VIPFLALSAEGGWEVVAAQVVAAEAGGGSFLDPWALGAGALLGLVAIGLGSPGNPHILVRYMSIDDERNLRFAAVTGTAANVVMGAGAVFIGIVGRAHFPDVGLLGGDTENLYPMLAAETLPPVLFGVVVASIFAAIMSTADSQLLVGASAVVRDVYEKGIRGGQRFRTPRWSAFPGRWWSSWCWGRLASGGWRRTWSSGWSSSPGPAWVRRWGLP